MRLAYSTPQFSSSDPLVCHSLQLRPSLWEVVFGSLGDLGEAWPWRQDDPSNATVDQVTAEIQAATDAAIFAGCIMIGQIIELAVETPPTWMLRCDGAVYLIEDYPELAAVIHPGFIDDETHFHVPDRNQRLGVDGFYPATQGGEAAHTLTEAEIPAHTHSYNEPTGEFLGLTGEQPAVLLISPFGVTGSTGGGEAHNNWPPYEGIQYYIIARYPSAGG